jgi:DNA repair protein RadC
MCAKGKQKTHFERMTYTAIRDWAPDDRPREKLLKNGPGHLSNAELLAILIHTGRKNRSAVDIARDVLELNKQDLGRMAKMRVKDFMQVRGIGKAKAVALAAAMELGRRRQSVTPVPGKPITQSTDAVHYLQPLLKDQFQEVLVVLYLNQAGVVVHEECLSRGGIASTCVDVRLILKIALEQMATGIILCHNHPGGSTKPSQADILTTRQIREAASQLDIRLLDHLIVSEHGYYSFAGEGRLS